MVGEKGSRSMILKKACDYIDTLKSESTSHESDIAELKSQNEQLEAQSMLFLSGLDRNFA